MNKYLSYDDVLLVPRYSELESRDLADTTVNLCGYKFNLPVCPANMEDVINVDIARSLSENGHFYIMHRFNDITRGFVRIANEDGWNLISISTGVNDESLEELRTAKSLKFKIDFITIDVAHAHHIKVKNRIQWIKENLPNTKIIAGNIATYEGYRDLCEWGADVVKAGVGQGSICTTRFQTGFSIPMFSCIKKILDGKELEIDSAIQIKNIWQNDKNHIESGKALYQANYGEFEKRVNLELDKSNQLIDSSKNKKNIPIIADGGLKYSGDIAKALVAGATMVMTGKLFASCLDSPAQIVDNKKQYRGSTSFAAKKHNKHIEGKTVDLEADITFKERLQEIKEALQSSISYGGGNNLECFKEVEWIKV